MLAIDLLGHGLSDDPWELARLTAAIRVVVAGARAQGATRVALVAAGASADAALAIARLLFARCAGWSLLSSLPTTEQGTALLAGAWGGQAQEQNAGFLRDYV